MRNSADNNAPDFARGVRTSLAPTDGNDLCNKTYVDANIPRIANFKVLEGGSAVGLPSGWSVSKPSNDIIRVTHNQGKELYFVATAIEKAVQGSADIAIMESSGTSFSEFHTEAPTGTHGDYGAQFICVY